MLAQLVQSTASTRQGSLVRVQYIPLIPEIFLLNGFALHYFLVNLKPFQAFHLQHQEHIPAAG